MPDAARLLDRLDPATASRLVDAALLLVAVAAVAVCWLTGLAPRAIAALVVASVALEHGVSWVTRRRLLSTATATGEAADAELRDRIAALADRMGVPTPRVVVEGSLGAGVTVLQGSTGPVLLLSRSFLSDLDDAALDGVIAHELAHLQQGHLGWLGTRDPVAHVVGATAFWLVAGQHLAPPLAAVGLATYVGAGVFRGSPLPELYYFGASLGVVLVPLGLIALAHRLDEQVADDRAASVTTPRAFCRGLAHAGTVGSEPSLPSDLVGTAPASERRGLIARVTATHPPLERRLARFGFAVDDVTE